MGQYVFQCVTPQAELIELVDECCPLSSVRPVFRVLRVIEREGDKQEKLLKSQIGNLIGKSEFRCAMLVAFIVFQEGSFICV